MMQRLVRRAIRIHVIACVLKFTTRKITQVKFVLEYLKPMIDTNFFYFYLK